MKTVRSLAEIKRASPEATLAGLLNKSQGQSIEAASNLIAEAGSFGLGLRDYLRLAIDPRLSENAAQFAVGANDNELLNGYEASLKLLNLPTRNDFDGGITLQLAADTFQTFAGVRAFFPEVIDDMVHWNYRQTNFEDVSQIVSQSRTIAGAEILTTVVQDTQADYQDAVRAVSEGGRIPIHSIRASQQSAKMWKFGSGYKTTYEFNRRVSLDYLTPYAARTQTETQRSKVAVATYTLINGDGVTGAAPVVTQSSFNGQANVASVNGTLSWKHMTAWFAARAQAGAPIDTVVGNWNAYLQWLWLFEMKGNGTVTDAEKMAASGFRVGGVPILSGQVNFALSTTMPDNQLMGLSKAFTIEELVEAGSLITESERSIKTQEVTYVRTEDSGYRLVFGDTRSIFNYNG